MPGEGLGEAMAGFGPGLSLILAIGAQNAFVLRQGRSGRHVLAVCTICALSDALLVAAGIFGLGALIGIAPWFEPAMRWGGAAFLAAYGVRAAMAAWRGDAAIEADAGRAGGLGAALGTTLALTWLNPHVYLDTVVLLGGIANQGPAPSAFGLGAVLASFTFFLGLGYGARVLAPLFRRPAAWRVLDAVVALTMWAIALKLVL